MATVRHLLPFSFLQTQSVTSSPYLGSCSLKPKRSSHRGNAKVLTSNNLAAFAFSHSLCCGCKIPGRNGSFCQPFKTLVIKKVTGVSQGRGHCSTAIGETELEATRRLNSQIEISQTSSESAMDEYARSLSTSLPGEKTENDIKQVHQVDEASCSQGEEENVELEKGYQMSKVCDRLIEVFMIEKPKAEEWRKLLAFSEEWRKIRRYFFKRCKFRADSESDPPKKLDLLKLARRLKKVDDDMERHNELLAYVEEHLVDVDLVVARRRKDFTSDFFQHLQLLSDSNYKNFERRDEIARIASNCLATIEAHDSAADDHEALRVAQLKFDDILNSPSLGAACNKIDELAKLKQFDSTLMLVMTKAWAAAKESNMMKEEVKDIMYHLYTVARGNLQRLVPKEVRIIRHILSIEDPCEQIAGLTEAFSPGDEHEGKHADHLYTTPDKMHKWIKIILDAYYTNKQSTLMESARQLMNPNVISRLEFLKEALETQYM